VIGLVAGSGFSCLATSSSSFAPGGPTVECRGRNDFGQLGLRTVPAPDYRITTWPPPIQGLDDAVQIAAGARHVCALRHPVPNHGGQVFCWGDGSDGQLGDGVAKENGSSAYEYGSSTPVAVVAPVEASPTP